MLGEGDSTPMYIKQLAVLFALFLLPVMAFSEDSLTKAQKEGFHVWKETSVKGPFKGCEADKTIHFNNGLSFKCAETEALEHSTSKVTILKSPKTGAHRVFIGDKEFQGQLQGKK